MCDLFSFKVFANVAKAIAVVYSLLRCSMCVGCGSNLILSLNLRRNCSFTCFADFSFEWT